MPRPKRVLITGITGQDGSYLAEFLLGKGYEVHGLMRRTSTQGTHRIEGILEELKLHTGDLCDQVSLERALLRSDPDEVYNFAAQSFVAASFEAPLHTGDVTGLGCLRLLEAIRARCRPDVRLYQASSSEMFGAVATHPQNEDTAFHPVSPYGCAKVFAHLCCRGYRDAYRMFIVCGIGFNHESERRGEEFVTRKISKAVAEIEAGQRDTLWLGNIEARRDWMHAQDLVRGAWLALQHETPDDYVFASGLAHSVREFVQVAFAHVELDPAKYVREDPRLRRPRDVPRLVGDAEKAYQVLGWKPRMTFRELVERMVSHDCALLDARDPRRAQRA